MKYVFNNIGNRFLFSETYEEVRKDVINIDIPELTEPDMSQKIHRYIRRALKEYKVGKKDIVYFDNLSWTRKGCMIISALITEQERLGFKLMIYHGVTHAVHAEDWQIVA